jgi:L-alanine-DL-glutamate epimerase-like enolase superfamily enzyme
MKITAIEAIVCALPLRTTGSLPLKLGKTVDMMLVRVETDQGLVGWGETFALAQAWQPARVALQTTVAPRCIGRDAGAIQALTREMQVHIHQLGRSGSVLQAWSGVETALWDLLGKSLGVPLHRLLGGAQQSRLPAYASLPRYGNEQQVLAQTHRALEQGYRAVKLHEVQPALVRAASVPVQAAGADLMVDVNAAWTLEEAQAALRALEGVPLRWLEEPLRPADDYEALARLKAGSGVAIAAGECASAITDFHTMLRLDAVDVLQPSVAKLGGVGAARRVFELGADTAIEVAPHTPLYGPALLATLHLCAAFAPKAQVEHFYTELECSPFEACVPRDGAFTLPSGPGLGCEPDPDILRRCRIA